MKIEKISENQIKCTLTQEDLIKHHLKLSELAFGTEKAKTFFREMMEEAADQYGFEVDNRPLMIEAIPSPTDVLTLVITKVEDPDSLDQRFPRFDKSVSDQGSEFSYPMPDKLDGAETLMDLINKIQEKFEKKEEKEKSKAEKEPEQPFTSMEEEHALRVFSFSNLDFVIAGARLLNNMYDGANTLYKDASEDVYVLAMSISDYSANEFNRICNMMTEYGTAEKPNGAMLAYLEEHCVKMISDRAVQELGKFGSK